MKIAFIVPSLAAKGPVIVAKDLSNLMINHGHSCVVYYFDNIVELEFNAPTKLITTDQKIDFNYFDIVHSHGLRPDKYVAKNRENSGKIKYISTVHNYMFVDFRFQYNWFVAQFFGRIWLRLLKRFDKIVALSKDAEKYYNQWFDEQKITYAYNSRIVVKDLDLTDKEKEDLLKFKGEYKLIGINALLTKRKGIDLVIKALPKLPEYKLFIVGNGKSRDELETLAKSYNVHDRCSFSGFVKDAFRYIPYYDLYAMPSRSEGFPLSLLEVSQYSKPTICSKIPIFEEIFSTDEVSFFELDNIDSIVKAIKYATDNNQLGINMNHRFEECYTPNKMYERYLAIYNGEI